MFQLGKEVRGMMRWSLQQRMQRWITWNVLSRALRVKVEGLENVPKTGPYILIWNHLHISDGIMLWSRVPAPTVFLATDKFRRKNWLVHVYLRGTGSIMVRNGSMDRQAVKRALQVLRDGNPVALAPEGRISQTGALCSAAPGVASLVCHSGAKVVPVAIWGQRHAHKVWTRLRRPQVTIRFGAASEYPAVKPTASNLRQIVTDIMCGLARTLPPEFRGVYSKCEQRKEELCG
jgi:1-acyl-sn-glycerol-3-phosphate acyltransferase